MRILDRMVLAYAWPALAAAAMVEAVVWVAFGATAALPNAAFIGGGGTAIVYAHLVRTRQVRALGQAGISPRRIPAAVVAAAAVMALAAAALACAVEHPTARTRYAGFVLSAAQLPLLASIAFPVVLRSRRKEPWADIAALLLGYVALLVAVAAAGGSQGWAPGLDGLFADGALAAVDVALYRAATAPAAEP